MKLRRILLYVIGVMLFSVIVSCVAIWLFFFRGCGGNQEAVALARGLSQERLAQLFLDVQALNPTGQNWVYIDTRTTTPDAFLDLRPKSITNDGYAARLHLSGCFDDKAVLIVSGIGKGRRKEIRLVPGEAKDAIVLWQSE